MGAPTFEDRLQRIADGELLYSNMENALEAAGADAAAFEQIHGAIKTALSKRVAAIDQRLAGEEAQANPQLAQFWTYHRDRFARALADAEAGRDATLVDTEIGGIVVPGSAGRNTAIRRYSYQKAV